MDGNAVEDNYRPTKGLNGRTVYHHDVNVDDMSGGGGPEEPEGPCFVNGSIPVGIVECCLVGAHIYVGDDCPAPHDCSSLTADQSGAETCQGICEVCVYRRT